jgi:hypothetical protein
LATLIVLAIPASARASFTFVGTFSPAGGRAVDARVAMAPNGDAVFVWGLADGGASCGLYPCVRIQVRSRSAAGTLSPIETISPPDGNAFYPEVAVDADGDAVITWGISYSQDPYAVCCSQVQAIARSAAGVLSPIQTLTNPTKNSDSAQVRVDPSGNAVFEWTLGDATTDCSGGECHRVQTRTRSAAGVLSAVQTLSPSGQNAYGNDFGLDDNGNAVYSWTAYSTTQTRILTRTRSAAGTLGPVEGVSALGQQASLPRAAVDPSGDAVFSWILQYGTTECGGQPCYRIMARARSSAGSFGPVQGISNPAANIYDTELAISANGDAVFEWANPDGTTDCAGGPCSRIMARARSATGTLSAIQTLSAAGQHADEGSVAVDSRGNAVFVWRREDGKTFCDGYSCRRIQARARSTAGALSPVQTLSGPGEHACCPAVAVDPDGGFDQNVVDAAADWLREDSTSSSCCSTRIQAAVQIAPPPS